MLPQGFTKQTAICPNEIVRGTINSTEAGYQPMGAQPRDYTDFDQVITGFDPIIIEWEDSVEFPFDGTLDQRYDKSRSAKVRGLDNTYTEEKEKVFPIGSVFEYDVDSGRKDEHGDIIWEPREYKLPKLDGEADKEYQERFLKNIQAHIEAMQKEDREKKLKDRWGRQYVRGINSKYIVRKFKTGRYYSAYFLTDESSMIIQNWLGAEHFTSIGVQKRLNLLILNTENKEVFPGVKAEGFIGDRAFFDDIDKYRRCVWQIPEYDLTYDLDNNTENEEKKRKGYRGSALGVDRTYFRIEKIEHS